MRQECGTLREKVMRVWRKWDKGELCYSTLHETCWIVNGRHGQNVQHDGRGKEDGQNIQRDEREEEGLKFFFSEYLNKKGFLRDICIEEILI